MMENSTYDLENLSPEQVDLRPVLDHDLVLFGEYHPLKSPKLFVSSVVPQLMAAGFTQMGMEGIPFGVNYKGGSGEEIVKEHFASSRNVDVTDLAAMFDAVLAAGINISGIDMTAEEAAEQKKLMDQNTDIQEQKIAVASEQLMQFQTLLRLAMSGTTIEEIRAAGITLPDEVITGLTKGSHEALEFFPKLFAEIEESSIRTVEQIEQSALHYRDGIFTRNLTLLMTANNTFGYMGEAHVETNRGDSTTNRLRASGIRVGTVQMVAGGFPDNQSNVDWFNSKTTSPEAAMVKLTSSDLLVHLPEQA